MSKIYLNQQGWVLHHHLQHLCALRVIQEFVALISTNIDKLVSFTILSDLIKEKLAPKPPSATSILRFQLSSIRCPRLKVGYLSHQGFVLLSLLWRDHGKVQLYHSGHALAMWHALPHLKQNSLFVSSLASTRFGRLTKLFKVADLLLDLPSGSFLIFHFASRVWVFYFRKTFQKVSFYIEHRNVRPSAHHLVICLNAHESLKRGFRCLCVICHDRILVFHSFTVTPSAVPELRSHNINPPLWSSIESKIIFTQICRFLYSHEINEYSYLIFFSTIGLISCEMHLGDDPYYYI